MARWMVTGAAGFIGSNIVEELISRGEEVVGLDNLSTGNLSNIKHLKDKFAFIQGSITDFDLLKKNLSRVDYILHLAAIPSVPRSTDEPLRCHEANCLGTLNVLLAAKEINEEEKGRTGREQIKKIIFAASSSAYGNISNHLPEKTEDLPVDPLSNYAAMKVYGENLCRTFYESYGLKTVSLRYFNVFGKNQDPNSPYSAVIPLFVRAMLDDERPIIFGDGKTSRDFTHVKNNVIATIDAALSENVGKGEVINIAMGKSVTLLELVGKINEILGKDIEPIFADERTGDVKHSKASIRKAKELIGYSPVIGFDEGLRMTIDYYRSL